MPSRGGRSQCGSQWLRNSRPRRLVTAAGPSRIHTGVPCLPETGDSPSRPPESWRQCIGAPERVKQAVSAPRLARCDGRANKPPQNMPVVRLRAAQPVHAKRAEFFTQRARVSRVAKNTWRHSSRFRHLADSPLVPRGNHCARRATRGRQSPAILRVTEWLDRPAAEKFVDHKPRGDQQPQERKSTSVCSTSKGDVAR